MAATSETAGGRLRIDLAALVANWRELAEMTAPAEVAGVVKADAYGLSIEPVTRALAGAGCRTFFVAFPDEGVAVRAVTSEARIFVLNGLFSEQAAETYRRHALVPCLNSVDEIRLWQSFHDLPCALMVDTGMNRLGLTLAEAAEIARARTVRPILVLSHLAGADGPEHRLNAGQLDQARQLAGLFPDAELSLANSAGIFLGPDAHHAQVRPGIALFGGMAPMRTVVTAEARVAQLRHARAGETVSYGATQTLSRDIMIAVCAVGYADGVHRAQSGAGVALRAAVPEGGHGFIAGRRVPLLGRVTMDALMFDVTDCGDGAVRRGDWIELFGPNLPIEEAAKAAGTISYELLTSLGRRWHRDYEGGADG